MLVPLDLTVVDNTVDCKDFLYPYLASSIDWYANV